MGKTVQTVDISKHDWNKEPYRLDPQRGYLLCKPCWDGQHFDPAYFDAAGTKHPKVANCKQGLCHCGCRPEFQDRARKPKFTGEGQISFLDQVDGIQIGVKS